MAKQKEKNISSIIRSLRREIVRDINMWQKIKTDGCNDPSWTDGENMELCRNHVIHDKYWMKTICEENGISLPDEYYLPTPPEVDGGYMARLTQTRRVKRLRSMGHRFTRKAPEYDPWQMCLSDFAGEREA